VGKNEKVGPYQSWAVWKRDAMMKIGKLAVQEGSEA
jgi:hypothetical protein